MFKHDDQETEWAAHENNHTHALMLLHTFAYGIGWLVGVVVAMFPIHSTPAILVLILFWTALFITHARRHAYAVGRSEAWGHFMYQSMWNETSAAIVFEGMQSSRQAHESESISEQVHPPARRHASRRSGNRSRQTLGL